jgi:hypothetical protein
LVKVTKKIEFSGSENYFYFGTEGVDVSIEDT